MNAPALPPGCPWSTWLPPNVNWCEAEACAVIVNPAGAWSNLAYVVLGLWMWRNAVQSGRPGLVVFGATSIFVGVCSFAYHASYTAFFQFFDFVAMFAFCMTVIAVNAARLGWISRRRVWALGGVGVVVLSALVPVVAATPVPIQAMVFVLILGILWQEWLAARRQVDSPPPRHTSLWVALALISAAAAFSLADVTRTMCDPADPVFQGHAIWHVLSAASLVALYIYQRDLESSGLPRA